jgi:hypothetical protein
MNLPKEYVDIYKNYLKEINEIQREIRSIRRRQKFITKTENVAEIIEESPKSKIYTFSDGKIYIGKLINLKMNGMGTLSCIDENNQTTEYTGEFVDNMKEGKGMYTFANANVYVGNFSDDFLNGIGQMSYISQDEYIGNWENGLKHGHGIYKWSEGCIYIGDFKKGKMDGYGVCLDKSGKVIYKGEWKNNLIDGFGTYYWEDGNWYEGDFIKGKKHGFGTFYMGEELVYEGTWKFDKPSIFNRTLDEIFSIKL